MLHKTKTSIINGIVILALAYSLLGWVSLARDGLRLLLARSSNNHQEI